MKNEIKEKNLSKNKFIRWQNLTISEFGKTINFLLGILFATLGFSINSLLEKEFRFQNCLETVFIMFGIILLLISIVTFLLLIFNRQKDFRLTSNLLRIKSSKSIKESEIEKSREEIKEIGVLTHCIFKIGIILFFIAELLVVVGFGIHIFINKM